MNQTINIQLSTEDGTLPGIFKLEEIDGKCCLELCVRNENYNGVGSDYFAALIEVRKQTDLKKYKLLINGSRLDGWPSRMTTQMSHGLKIYKLNFGKQSSTVLETFAPTDPTQVATVDEQMSFVTKHFDEIEKR